MLYLEIVLFIVLVFVFIRYEPKIDLVVSYNKKFLLLWYNKFEGKYVTRTYIKLFSL